jgi:hypothetical protein
MRRQLDEDMIEGEYVVLEQPALAAGSSVAGDVYPPRRVGTVPQPEPGIGRLAHHAYRRAALIGRLLRCLPDAD